jgi:hypothetical protein
MDGLAFARESGARLNTHLIIHWGGTLAGDDPDGMLFAKFRYLPRLPIAICCCICPSSIAKQRGTTFKNSLPWWHGKFSMIVLSSSHSPLTVTANIF